MGYVSVEGDNLLGEGVNVAARLESFCLPGGIAISKNVYDLVHNKTDLVFDDVGVQNIKNTKAHVFDVIFLPNQERRKKLRTKRRFVLISTSFFVVLSASAALLILYKPTGIPELFEKRSTQNARAPTKQTYGSLGFLQLENKSGFVRYDNISQKVSEHILHNFGGSASLRIDAYFEEKPLREVLADLGDSGAHDLKFLIYGYLTERINDYKIDVCRRSRRVSSLMLQGATFAFNLKKLVGSYFRLISFSLSRLSPNAALIVSSSSAPM